LTLIIQHIDRLTPYVVDWMVMVDPMDMFDQIL